MHATPDMVFDLPLAQRKTTRSIWQRLPIGFYLLACLAFDAFLAYLLFS